MKNFRIHFGLPLFLLVGLILMFSSCLKDQCDEKRIFLEYEPVYVMPAEFRVDVQTTDAREMEETGKFYFYNDYIFINERYKGIHVIDNNDPYNPENVAFIEIPGNLDMAVKGHVLYADSYVDLLSIDIRNIEDPVILCRDEDVFANYNFVSGLGYFVYNEATERSIEVECSDPNFGDETFVRDGNIFWLEDAATGNPVINTAGGPAAQTGIGGSFARFSLMFDHLYVLNSNELIAYDLSNPEKPVETATTNVSWGAIETLFAYENYLFIGANNGMYIYDASYPSSPVYVSEFTHATACDPVFVKDDIAYVTLRNGTQCQSFTNQLDVIDVSNIHSPELIATFPMEHPHGLSVRDNILYLCEGDFGLKVFKTDELTQIDENRIDHVKNINAFDAISLNSDHLLIIGSDGLYQFDTSDPSDLKEMSFFSVSK